MKKILVILAGLIVLAAVGCQSDPPIADATRRNKDGEVEGKEPTFVMVPAQGDPNKK